jgi:hypothetical protein
VRLVSETGRVFEAQVALQDTGTSTIHCRDGTRTYQLCRPDPSIITVDFSMASPDAALVDGGLPGCWFIERCPYTTDGGRDGASDADADDAAPDASSDAAEAPDALADAPAD